MKCIFTIPGAGKDEVRESNFRTFYPNINPAMKWATILPFIEDAVRINIYPYIGADFYDKVANNSDPDPIKTEIKTLLSGCIAKYAIYQAMPHINVTISDMGVQQNRNEKSGNASQWAYQQARWNTLYSAERYLDELLNYLYENKSNAWIDDWTTSEAYKATFTDFIQGRKALAELSSFKTIRGFWTLYPFILRAESDVKHILGTRTYEDILIKRDNDTLSNSEKYLFKQLQLFIADRAVAEALPSMTIMIEDGNAYSVSVSDVPNVGVNTSANLAAVNTLREQTRRRAETTEQDIRRYLVSHLADFPLWEEDCYVPGRPISVFYSPHKIGGIMI